MKSPPSILLANANTQPIKKPIHKMNRPKLALANDTILFSKLQAKSEKFLQARIVDAYSANLSCITEKESSLIFCYLVQSIGSFRFGFLGNHPFSTRRACSCSSRILHRQETPASPKIIESIPFVNRAASKKPIPAAKNNGQILWEK